MNKAKITERLQETPPQELKPKRQGDLFPVAESEGTAHHPCPEAIENVTMDRQQGTFVSKPWERNHSLTFPLNVVLVLIYIVLDAKMQDELVIIKMRDGWQGEESSMLWSLCGSQMVLCFCQILTGNWFKSFFLHGLLPPLLQKFPLKDGGQRGVLAPVPLLRTSLHCWGLWGDWWE